MWIPFFFQLIIQDHRNRGVPLCVHWGQIVSWAVTSKHSDVCIFYLLQSVWYNHCTKNVNQLIFSHRLWTEASDKGRCASGSDKNEAKPLHWENAHNKTPYKIDCLLCYCTIAKLFKYIYNNSVLEVSVFKLLLE